MHNALTEISWVRTSAGAMTPRDALLHAHEIESLDLSAPALEVSSTYRLLCQLFALAVREMDNSSSFTKAKQVDPAALDRAIESLGSAVDLFDDKQPFMQRPALQPANKTDRARKIGRGDQPVKKLFPFMPSDQAERFWELSVETDHALDLPEATLALVVFHNFSMAGNNRYDGDKCQMGAPGIRFPGQDNTATEMIWKGQTLLDTLSLNTPKSWVDEGGLPAWADRTGAVSRDPRTGSLPSLWASSWSSNAAVAYWEDNRLAGVRTGGVPAEWLPIKGIDDKALKKWWDDRNTQDPFYLYVPDRAGDLKAQRLDLQRDTLDLAVEWNAESKAEKLISAGRQHVSTPHNRDLIFFRHQVGGTASSPSIRASQVLVGNRDVWAPSEDVAENVRVFAELIRKLHFTVTGAFRRKRASDKATGGTAVLEALESRKADASAYFWREVSGAFNQYLAHVQDNPILTEDDIRALRIACMNAFDQAAEPYWSQHRQSVEQVRARVEGTVKWQTKMYETDD